MTERGFGEGDWCAQVPRHSPACCGQANTPCVPSWSSSREGWKSPGEWQGLPQGPAGAASGWDAPGSLAAGVLLLHHLQWHREGLGTLFATADLALCLLGTSLLHGMFSSLQEGLLCLKSILFPAHSLNKAG